MFIAGLTGNYGMGKSAVLAIFRKLGALTVDTDTLVHKLLNEKNIINKIKKLFGNDVFDAKSKVIRKKVAEKVFINKKLRTELEDILHPLVFKEIQKIKIKPKNKNKLIIVEAPVIFERGYEKNFDRTITVFAGKKTTLKRLGKSGISPETARQRLGCQMPIEKKIKMSDFSVNNSKTLQQTKKQAAEIFRKLLVAKLASEGKVEQIKKIAGRPFYIEGKVIKGAGRGGKILHIPTANLSVSEGTDIKEGVYAVKVIFDKHIYNGAANIGTNPTFGDTAVNYEVHLFDFAKNLLGKKLRVNFIKRIRDEKKFPSIKALEVQIKKDINRAKQMLSNKYEKT
ncbi:MAG: dephospho-CoA kinase [Nitrospiraceae bacterium]|nr:dephospho-CoA kinase [Nitrospiraceae bacterium]